MEARFGLGAEVIEEAEGAGAGVGHAVFEDEIGEVGEAEEGGLFLAELEDALDDGAVVAVAGSGADGEGGVDVMAGLAAIEIGHHGEIIGGLEGEAPAGEVLALGGFAGAGDGGGGQTGEIGLIGEDEFEGVGGIEDVLGEFGGDLGEFDVDGFEALLAGGIEIGAMAAEAGDGLVEEAAALAGERGGFGGGGEGFEVEPEAGFERDAGIEGADIGLRGVEGGAEFGIGGDAFEVADHAHGPIERFGESVEGVEGIVEGARGGGRGEGGEAGAGSGEEGGAGGFDVFGADAVERDPELGVEQGVGVGRTGHCNQRNRSPVPGTSGQ